MQNNANIALIYFSRYAEAESRNKQFASDFPLNRNRAVASSLILQTSQIVRKSDLPVFHYHEGNQLGNSFGERLANAYSEVFQLGYDAVIAVGNDSPELGLTNWNDVSEKLASGQCVLGPSLRGGAYLVGITAQAFDKKKFQQLPWQTSKLFEALKEFCSHENCDPHFLKALRDVNSLHDLKKLSVSFHLSRSFKRIIYLLIVGVRCYYLRFSSHIPNFFVFPNRLLRAPPL